MKLNIELVRKKEAANVVNFEYEVEDAVKSDMLELLMAKEIIGAKISGYVFQSSGLSAINYKIMADFIAECARCNQVSPQSISFSGEKYLADKADNKDENDEYYTLEHASTIDLREFLTEFLALEVPLRYLCSDSCKGLCQKCGSDLNVMECGCPKREINPAFKILDNFFE